MCFVSVSVFLWELSLCGPSLDKRSCKRAVLAQSKVKQTKKKPDGPSFKHSSLHFAQHFLLAVLSIKITINCRPSHDFQGRWVSRTESGMESGMASIGRCSSVMSTQIQNEMVNQVVLWVCPTGTQCQESKPPTANHTLAASGLRI